VCLAGGSVFAIGVARWESSDLLKFAFYVAYALVSSRLKVRLPGVVGNLSVNYVFILLGVVDLPLGQVVVLGALAAILQCLYATRTKAKPIQLLFSAAAVCFSIGLTHWIFHGPFFRSLDHSVPLLLFWTTTGYFLSNTWMVSGVIALTEGKGFFRVWYENFFWTGPQYLFGAGLTGMIHVCNQSFGWQYSTLFLPAIYLLYSSYSLYLGRLEREKHHVTEVAELHLRTIEALALAIEAKDDTTHTHLRRVQIYALEIARELGLVEEEIRALEAAALLHDIGKLAVPDYIINKPGRLTKEEFEKMKVHPVVGAEILECVRFPYPVVPIVRSHHEKWDGSGYPDGLKGEEIPIGARILSAVDCLDALASDRQYRRALPMDQALEHVCREGGRSFDPRVVAVLKSRCEELESRARTSQHSELSRLSTRARVARGDAPAAGLAPNLPSASEEETKPPDFILSIAAARQEFQVLHEVSRDLGNSLSMEDTLSLLATRMRSLVPFDGIAIYCLRNEVLEAQYASGEDSQLFSSLRIPLGEGLSGWVAQNRKPIVNGNPSVESGYLADPQKFSLMRSALAVPLDTHDRVIGTLALYRRESDAFTNDHLRILLAVGSKAAMTIENALLYQRVEENAVTDPLTGLPNAGSLFLHLERELQASKEKHGTLGVVVIDLDGFKQINDRFGHLDGNRVLQLVADGLRKICRESDFVARMGGDEFVVILPGITGDALESRIKAMTAVVEQVGVEVCREPILGMSAGAVLFPADGADAEGLLNRADQRMYEIKRQHHASHQQTAVR
jgi:diguanylate cyclase (GGDEF)-like protein/putative nucleotidyltransferase with HDIG domain